jgi:hypothetical protein
MVKKGIKPLPWTSCKAPFQLLHFSFSLSLSFGSLGVLEVAAMEGVQGVVEGPAMEEVLGALEHPAVEEVVDVHVVKGVGGPVQEQEVVRHKYSNPTSTCEVCIFPALCLKCGVRGDARDGRSRNRPR